MNDAIHKAYMRFNIFVQDSYSIPSLIYFIRLKLVTFKRLFEHILLATVLESTEC